MRSQNYLISQILCLLYILLKTIFLFIPLRKQLHEGREKSILLRTLGVKSNLFHLFYGTMPKTHCCDTVSTYVWYRKMQGIIKHLIIPKPQPILMCIKSPTNNNMTSKINIFRNPSYDIVLYSHFLPIKSYLFLYNAFMMATRSYIAMYIQLKILKRLA